MTKETVTNFVILVVVGLWAISILAVIFDHSFQVPGTLQLIMTGVAAYLFGKQALSKAKTQEKPEEGTKEQSKP